MPRNRPSTSKPVAHENVEQYAETLLRRLDLYSVPVSVERVAAKLGLHIERTAFGDDVSGVLVVQDGQGMIGVNAAHSPVRQRFTVAHEIGHYQLHREELPVFIDKGNRQVLAAFRDGASSSGDDRREREANGFAAALLMPAQLVRDAIARFELDVEDDDAVAILAEKFRVSSQAMSFRIVKLQS